MKKILSIILTGILLVLSFSFSDTQEVQAANKPLVIVIDPGHGGTGERNLGAQYNNLSEKELTLQVANAMYNELSKYDNVQVYLTRTTDIYVSLEDRAEFAKSVNADFVYSIHFNASTEHNYYGSEVWTSAFGTYYQKGYDFGWIELQELEKLGIYSKDVKTKLGGTGKDYYGIIRASVARNIPCVIIEHAYIDHGYDVPKIKSEGFMQKLGVSDATAVAKYFNLKSSANGNDFTSYSYKKVSKPSGIKYNDSTDPDVCSINVLSFDKASRNALVEMTAKDYQSPIIYFTYSYDGGNTFYTLQMWDRSKTTQSFNVNIPGSVKNPDIVCRVYNSYEKFADSNHVSLDTSK